MKKYKEIFNLTHAIYRAANSSSDIKNLISGLLRIIQQAFSLDSCSMVLFYPNKNPFIKGNLKRKNFSLKRGGKTILTKKEREIFKTGRIHFSKKTIVAPLIFINVLGLITLKKTKSKYFEDTERKLLILLIEEISLVVRNFQLYEEHRKTIIGTIRALTQFLNKYSPSSVIHTQLTQKILKELAKIIPLTQQQLTSLEYAALLHDTGKIDIPQTLLKKNTPLSREEIEIIKKHPRKGAEILKNLQALRPVIPIILYHHEKYDGSGYPSGLKKKQIPLEARILSVIDAFDAMFFGRPYKKSLTLEKCIKELEKNKGKQFDPQVVDSFIKVLNTKRIKKYLKGRSQKV
ncbi:MAG: HD domain-containing protein [Candidatus Omnitrophica bacterium]|nr:HD domain-containing protein [Candidatus Omnitrophota bacterium]